MHISLLVLCGALLSLRLVAGSLPKLPHAPWGWNAYNVYHGVNETELLRTAEGLVQQLQSHGYEYINLDAGWMGPEFDGWGRPLWDSSRWPMATQAGTMRVYSDHLASLGLRFGMYWTRGVNNAAVNKIVKGTAWKVGDIVSHAKHSGCPWGGGKVWLGVNETHPGAQPYYDSIIEMFVDWGVSFLKMDCIEFNVPDIQMLNNAIAKFNNSILLSLSPGGKFRQEWGQQIAQEELATQYRIVNDFHGGFWEMRTNIDQAVRFAAFVGVNNTYPDLDMAPFGKGARNGHAGDAEQEFYSSLYMILRAPLLFGGELPDLTGAIRYFNNSVALTINANSTGLRVVAGANTSDPSRDHIAFAADLLECPALDTQYGCNVFAVFNLLEVNLTNIQVPLTGAGNYKLFHVWTSETVDAGHVDKVELSIAKHSAAFFLAQRIHQPLVV